MAEIYVSDEDVANGANPHFESAGRVHDWRNHVPEHVQKIWGTFTPEQRKALVEWADELASSEHWD